MLASKRCLPRSAQSQDTACRRIQVMEPGKSHLDAALGLSQHPKRNASISVVITCSSYSPPKLQVDTLRDLHEGAIGGHLGEEKMLNKLKERFYWPGCTEAVKDWCRTCIRCTTRKTAACSEKKGAPTIITSWVSDVC